MGTDEPSTSTRTSDPAEPAPAAMVSTQAVRAHLARPEVLERIATVVRAKVPARHAEDVVGDVHVAILSAATRPQNEAALGAWCETIAARVIAHKTRKDRRRAPYLGFVEDVDDAPAEEPEVEGLDVQLTPWLEKRAAGEAYDAETLALLKEKARENLTYEDLGERHGVSEAALKKHVARFVAKYSVRRSRERERDRLVMAVLLGFGLALAVAVLAYVLMQRARVSPSAPVVTPERASASASASAAPPPAPAPSDSDIAAPPTVVPGPAKPPLPAKPPKPPRP